MTFEKEIVVNLDNSERVLGELILRNDAPSNLKRSSGDGIFQPGDELISRVCSLISQAKEVICISSFIMEKSKVMDELKKSAQRGVRLYILTAAETQLENSSDDDITNFNERKENARELINALGKWSLIRSGSNLHSKFIIVDPKSNPKGMLLTANLTVRAMTENFELGVELSPDQVNDVFHQFKIAFWSQALREHTLSHDSSSSLISIEKHPEFVNTDYEPKSIRWTVGSFTLIKEELQALIKGAESKISVSAWTFSTNHELTTKLLSAAENGIHLTVFTRPSDANLEFIRKIIAAGSEVYCHPLFHGKSILIDGQKGFIMTSNFSSLGLDSGFETGVMLNGKQVHVLERILSEWKSFAKYRYAKGMKLHEINVPFIPLSQGIKEYDAPEPVCEFSDAEQSTIDISDYTAGKIEQPKAVKPIECLKEVHRIKLKPPLLPKNAKEIRLEGAEGFRIFEQNKEKFLAITDESDYQQASSIAKTLGLKIVFTSDINKRTAKNK